MLLLLVTHLMAVAAVAEAADNHVVLVLAAAEAADMEDKLLQQPQFLVLEEL